MAGAAAATAQAANSRFHLLPESSEFSGRGAPKGPKGGTCLRRRAKTGGHRRGQLLAASLIEGLEINSCADNVDLSRWGVMGWHAGWNWAFATGYELRVTGLDAHVPALFIKLIPRGPDYLTGGAEGPEGSLPCILLLAAGAALLGWRLARHGRFAGQGSPPVDKSGDRAA